MFFKKNKCPNCGEVLDDNCYCFNCGTAIHNDNNLNDCESISHKKVTYSELNNNNFDSQNKKYINTINNEPILYSVDVTNQNGGLLSFFVALIVTFSTMLLISFVFYFIMFSLSIILSITNPDISYITELIISFYSNYSSILSLIIFVICFIKGYKKSKTPKKWARTSHYLGCIIGSKIKTVYNVDEISKFYINGNTICFKYGTKTVQMLTNNNAEEILDKLTYY